MKLNLFPDTVGDSNLIHIFSKIYIGFHVDSCAEQQGYPLVELDLGL